jgi:hypothetical protein
VTAGLAMATAMAVAMLPFVVYFYWKPATYLAKKIMQTIGREK